MASLRDSCVSLYYVRLDAESPSQLDQASLLSHMESASISNELLRCELHNLKANQADLHSQLDVAKRLLEQKEKVSKKEHLEQREKVVRKELPVYQEEVQRKTKVCNKVLSKLTLQFHVSGFHLLVIHHGYNYVCIIPVIVNTP